MSLVSLGAGPPPDFSDPVGMWLACHRRIEHQLSILARSVAALQRGGEAEVAAARVALTDPLRYFAEAGVRHSLDEDASFFPRVQSPVLHELTAEHREHEAIFLAVRTVAHKVIAGDTAAERVDELDTHARALAAAYTDHIAREEAACLPIFRALDERELRAIGLEMRIRRG